MKLKRYLLFAGYNYYPEGGWGDFKGSFDRKLEALEKVENMGISAEWYEIVDTETGLVVL